MLLLVRGGSSGGCEEVAVPPIDGGLVFRSLATASFALQVLVVVVVSSGLVLGKGHVVEVGATHDRVASGCGGGARRGGGRGVVVGDVAKGAVFDIVLSGPGGSVDG